MIPYVHVVKLANLYFFFWKKSAINQIEMDKSNLLDSISCKSQQVASNEIKETRKVSWGSKSTMKYFIHISKYFTNYWNSLIDLKIWILILANGF